MNLTFLKTYKHYFFLFLIALLAYWQIGFLLNSLKYDMIDGFLPLRYFTAECLKNNIFPFWNPYQQCGFPIYANLICTWNPELIFTGFLFGYNNITLHFFQVFYIFLAGVGMYKLLIFFTKDSRISFLIGTSYMLSGFFISHASHADYISGGAWIPFVVLYYIKFLKHPSLNSIIHSIFFTFLVITTGYPAISIILAYLLFILFLKNLVGDIINKRYKLITSIITGNLIIIITLLILCNGMILSWIQVSPFVPRFQSLRIDSVMINPFSPQSLISILFPFSTVEGYDFFKTDSTMNNIYIGLFLPIFFIFSVLNKKNITQYLFIFFGVFSLLLSMGDYLPLRKLAYFYFPLMDKFKYPSVFIIFSIFSFLIFSGIGLSKYKDKFKKHISTKYISFLLLFVLIGFSAYSFFKININDFSFFHIKSSLEETIRSSSIFERLFIQSIFQIIVLLIFILILFKNRIFKYLPIILVFELFISIQLNIYITGIASASPIKIYNHIISQPQGFPLPSNHNIIENKSSSCQFLNLCRNTNVISKRISFETYNAFIFSNYYKLKDNYSELKDSILNNPILYFSDEVFPESTINKGNINKKSIFISDSIYNNVKNLKIHTSRNDSITLQSFTPNNIEAEFFSENQQILTFLQSNYTGWKVFIDDEESEIITSNFLFMSTIIPAGKHKISFKYVNKPIITSFFIEFLGFIILCFLIYIQYFRNISKIRIKYIHIITLLLLIIILSLKIIYRRPYQKTQEKEYVKIANILNINEWINDEVILLNIDNYPKISKLLSVNSTIIEKQIRFDYDISQIKNLIDKTKSKNFIYIWSNVSNPPEILEIIREKYPKIIISKNFPHSSVYIFNYDTNYIRVHLFINTQDFHFKSKHWNYNENNIDTVLSISNDLMYNIQPQNEFGLSFNEKLSELTNDISGSVINIKINSQNLSEKESYLVLQIDDEKNNSIYKAVPINQSNENFGTWKKIYLSYKLPKNIDYERILKTYIWNPNKCNIYIDDFTIQLDKPY